MLLGVLLPSALFAPDSRPPSPPRLRLTSSHRVREGRCEFHTQLSLHRMNTPTGPDGTPWLQQEEGKVVGWAPNSLAFARRCCARLQCLLA